MKLRPCEHVLCSGRLRLILLYLPAGARWGGCMMSEEQGVDEQRHHATWLAHALRCKNVHVCVTASMLRACLLTYVSERHRAQPDL